MISTFMNFGHIFEAADEATALKNRKMNLYSKIRAYKAAGKDYSALEAELEEVKTALRKKPGTSFEPTTSAPAPATPAAPRMPRTSNVLKQANNMMADIKKRVEQIDELANKNTDASIEIRNNMRSYIANDIWKSHKKWTKVDFRDNACEGGMLVKKNVKICIGVTKSIKKRDNDCDLRYHESVLVLNVSINNENIDIEGTPYYYVYKIYPGRDIYVINADRTEELIHLAETDLDAFASALNISKTDWDRMTSNIDPIKILQQCKVRNIEWVEESGKRGRAYDKETKHLYDDKSFVKKFINAYIKYGKPIAVDYATVSHRTDFNDILTRSSQYEQEYDIRYGETVTIRFKGAIIEFGATYDY